MAMAKGKGKGKGKGKCAVAMDAPERKLPDDLSIFSQADMKKYMLADSYLWKCRASTSWCTRVPPFGVNSRSWKRHGERKALGIVVSCAWRQWCWLNGVDMAECPMDNLMRKNMEKPEAADADEEEADDVD